MHEESPLSKKPISSTLERGFYPSLRIGWIAILMFIATTLPCIAAAKAFLPSMLLMFSVTRSIESWIEGTTWCIAYLIPQWSFCLLRSPRPTRVLATELLLSCVPAIMCVAYGLSCSWYIATIEASDIANIEAILIGTLCYSGISWSAMIHLTGHIFAPSIVYKAPGGGLRAHFTID
jgi:hypothetical protein